MGISPTLEIICIRSYDVYKIKNLDKTQPKYSLESMVVCAGSHCHTSWVFLPEILGLFHFANMGAAVFMVGGAIFGANADSIGGAIFTVLSIGVA